MNLKKMVLVTLIAILCLAIFLFLIVSGKFRLREKLSAEGFQMLSEGEYSADISDHVGATVAKIKVRINSSLPLTDIVPVRVLIWHMEGKELDSLVLKITGQNSKMPIFLNASNSLTTVKFYPSEDGLGTVLEIENLDSRGTVNLDLLLFPNYAQQSFLLEVNLNMHEEGILPLVVQEVSASGTITLRKKTEILCPIDGSPYVITPFGSRSENFLWRCLECGHVWRESYPEDLYLGWRKAFLEPAFVRDYAILYLRDAGHERLPDPLNIEWTGGRETTPGLIGSETFVYRTKDIVVTIRYPVVLPENMIFEIRIEQMGIALWEGRLLQRQFLSYISSPLDKVVHDYYGGVGTFEEGIHIIATDKDPITLLDTEDFWKTLKGCSTKKASISDFVSIIISRGDFMTGGYQIQIKSFARLESYPVVLSFTVNFTDPGEGVLITEALTNPLVLVPIGNLEVGMYVVEVHVERFILTYEDSGNPIYTPIKTSEEAIWKLDLEVTYPTT